ncbi:MAG: OsmC family protein [Vicinamibacterales bacterium]
MKKPPITGTLTWEGGRQFRAATARTEIILDGDSTGGPSPPEALALALAGCMAIDVADIVIKGRHTLTALQVKVVGERREESPHYFVSFALHFALRGDVPPHAVERAIQLSHDKYCSVWHSLRQDLRLETSFEVHPAA